jgi:N-methylhydantoinase A
VNLLLGYLNSDFFLGGEMQVDVEAAKSAVEERIAAPLGMTVTEACAGIFRIINQNMADATKVVSVERGHDPREYALISAGGACSIHACKIAEEIGSSTVIVPKAASVFCALGMLESDIRLDSVRSYSGQIPGIDLKDFNAAIAEAEEIALAELLQEGVEKERATLLRFADIRYQGQHHEVTVEVPHGCEIKEEHVDQIADAFHRAHEKLYTYATPESPLEIMNFRITAVGAVDKADISSEGGMAVDPASAIKGERQVFFESIGDYVKTTVYDRTKLGPGNVVRAPAVIEERITTVIVHPGWSARIDGFGNIIMEEER